MVRNLRLRNFTAFRSAELEFGSGLNVIVGENGSGKSHLMQLLYAAVAANARDEHQPAEQPTKTALQKTLAEKLVNVLRPEGLGRLVRRKRGRERCEVRIGYDQRGLDVEFSFSTNSASEVSLEALPSRQCEQLPVYLPTRELLTLYPGFIAMYEGHYLEYPETWRDTCLLLGRPAVRGPRETSIRHLVAPLEAAMGGRVVLDNNGRFYLQSEGQGRFEMALVAEGLRKLAMLARLIVTGSVLDKGCLFWDEPDANLNPRLIRKVSATILSLANSGLQVFVATHSLFLLRELDIGLQQQQQPSIFGPRFFALTPSSDGVEVQQGDGIDEVDPIVSLDEDLLQSDRFLKAG